MTINIANKKLEEEVLPFGDTQYLNSDDFILG